MQKKFMEERKRIVGAVVPLNIPYKENEDIDYDAFEKYVDWLAGEGVPILLLTWGSSEYANITDKEIYELTKIGAQANSGRSHFVGGTKGWPVKECIKFVEHSRKYGASAANIQPECQFSIANRKLESLIEYYRLIGEATDFPLWAYTNCNILTPQVIKRIVDEVPWIIAIKNDDDALYSYYDYVKAAGDSIQIVTGGQMKSMLFAWQIGGFAYLCTISPFYPKIGIEFINCLQKNDYAKAKEIIHKWEDPVLDIGTKYNWLLVMKTFIYLRGLYPFPKLRVPSISLSDIEFREIKSVYEKLLSQPC